jgi:hypothetical protein
MEELINNLFENQIITKSKLEEFAKLCQLEMLYTVFENNNRKKTYNNVNKKFIELKNELLLDSNKLCIIANNYSLN